MSHWDGTLANFVTDRLLRIEASGVLLREYRLGDAAGFHAAFADAEIARWNPGPASPGAAAEFMGRRKDLGVTDHRVMACCRRLRLSGRLSVGVGVGVGVGVKIDADQGDAEVSYWVVPWARGRGARDSRRRDAAQFAFARVGLHRPYLFHAVENSGSCAVARAAG